MDKASASTFQHLKPNLEEFAPEEMKDPVCLLLKSYMFIIDKKGQDNNKLAVLNLQDLAWMKITFTGEELPIYPGTTICLDEDNLQILTCGGCPENQTVSASSKLGILKIEVESESELSIHITTRNFGSSIKFEDHLAVMIDSKMILIPLTGLKGYCYYVEDNVVRDLRLIQDSCYTRFSSSHFISDYCILQNKKMYGLERGAQINGLRTLSFSYSPENPTCSITESIDGFHDVNSRIHLLSNGKWVYFQGAEKDLASYDLKTKTRGLLGTQGKTIKPRYFHGSVVYKDNLIIFGGSGNGEANQVYSVNLTPSAPALVPTKLQNTPYQNFAKRPQPRIQNEDFKAIFEDMLFSDITFEVESEEIKAHRNILAQKSLYFRELFSRETSASSISVPDMTAEAFKTLLEYLYTGSVTLEEETAKELIRSQGSLVTDDLKAMCGDFLISKLSLENIEDMLSFSIEYGAEDLRKQSMTFLARNWKVLKSRINLDVLPKEMLKDLLINI